MKSIQLTGWHGYFYWYGKQSENYLRYILYVTLLLLVLPFVPGSTNADDDTDNSQLNNHHENIEQHRGTIVDSIVIENRNIFDTDSRKYRHFIFKLANKLHFKTRRNIIRREVLIKEKEVFSPELAEETARNLRSQLALFDAWIEVEILPNGHLLVRIVTIDEWSLSGGLNPTRDGNKTRYQLAVAERNLIGNNQYLSMKYIVQPSDKDYFVGRFIERRFLSKAYAVELGYSGNPLGKVRQISFSHPFYNLSQTYSFDLTVAQTSGRREVHKDTHVNGWSYNEGDLFTVKNAYRMGSYRQKIRIGSQYVYRYEQSFGAYNVDIADSLYHKVGGDVHLLNLQFAKMKQIDGFSYTEDYVLGQALQVGLARAFTNDFRDYVYDVLDFGVSQGYRFGPTLTFMTYERKFWFRRSDDIRRLARLSFNHYAQATRFLTIAARGTYLSDRADSTENVAVGGNSDIRGYDEFFRTGYRKAVFNLEGRFYPNVEILSILFGGTVFIDAARAWAINGRREVGGVYAGVGLGLRIALEHSSRSRLLRIDLAYSKKNGLQFSIGTGPYFKAQSDSFLLTTP